jgi:2-iminobutanoate/2-iminopropanoate deaminase
MSDRRTLFTEITTADALPPHYAYSQALVHGNLLYTQGVNPCDPVTAKVVGTTIEEQTERAMRNLSAILAAAGLSTDHVIKTSVHLADLLRDFEGFRPRLQQVLLRPVPRTHHGRGDPVARLPHRDRRGRGVPGRRHPAAPDEARRRQVIPRLR